MSLIADGLLIATCLTTALYCLVLSRRLRRLSDTDAGIGQQILRLNSALAETKAAVAEIRATSRAASEELERDIETAKKQSSQLQRQIARALKSGAGHPGDALAKIAGPAGGAGDGNRPRAEIDDDRTEEGRETPPPTQVVDFEAADPIDGEMGQDQDPEADDSFDRREFPSTGDISESDSHWPFSEEDDDEADQVDAYPEDGSDDDDRLDGNDQRAPTRERGSGRRRGTAEPGSGLLRVERMAV